jgi:HSP20 family molecular chaperone IbpA
MTDGILTINLERLVPDSQKPKKIDIAYLQN